ncbi:UDP-N-acetyl-D-mannosamine dehydrogenase [Actinomyces sp.]|uniref:UDP-N-acetyl-D-mannosamine dehydrogenase n=1 Tax=Actinomyces sp. TaxID=29317 RepID=UPI002899C20B|nr:UDP-N-acetyl-D-mannosamine dehydrogenase [Actinomyces sp.]
MSSSEVPESTDGRTQLCVVGLGYIGLPTAVVFARSGWDVLGVDVSERIVEMVNAGRLPFVEEGLEQALGDAVRSGRLRASGAPVHADVFIVSVPTPFVGEHQADLRYVDTAADEVAEVLRGGELVVLESTVPPGATEHMAKRILRLRPELEGRVDFAHAPERVLPGRIMAELRTNDRIVGGLTPAATQRAREVYASFCTGTISTTDARTAELSKLAENSFRDVNIAFANELSLICARLGIDVWELISLANHHPRVDILQPGPGVGGHCIAVDPWFIVSADPQDSRLIRTAREVNDGKPRWVIGRVLGALDALALGSPRVAVLGLAFKADIDDLRESPSVEIARELALSRPGVAFDVVEPNIATLPEQLVSLDNVALMDLDRALADADVVTLLVDHRQFRDLDPDRLSGKAVVDTRGVWRR